MENDASGLDEHGPGGADVSPRTLDHRFLILGLIAIGASLYVLRRPSTIESPVFWAEDGTIFFKDAVEAGWRAVFEPYAGQVLLFQRSVALLVAPMPTLIQPALYAVASIAAALSSTAILLSSRWRPQVPLWARFACMLALLCSPQVDDAFAILSNSHWWLAIGLMSLGMLRDPPGRLSRMGELVFTAVAGLSGFAAVFGLPILGVRAIRNRSRHSVAILAVAAGGALVQISYLVASGRHGALASIASDPGTALLVLVKRILATDALGPANLAALTPLKTLDWLVVFVAILLASALGFVWIRALRHQATRLEAAAFGLTFVGGWFLSMWALTMPGLSLDMLFWPAAAPRYFVVPTAALYLSVLLWQPGGRAALTALSVACVLLAAGILSGYRLLPMPSVDWAPFAECVDRGSPDCSVEIPPAWHLEVDARAR